MVQLSATITSAEWIEKRRRNARLLKKQLNEQNIPTNIVRVQEPDEHGRNWPDQKKAWFKHSQFDSTHHLVLQDDAKLCDNFGTLVHQVISAKPEQTIACWCTHNSGMDKAVESGVNWVEVKGGMHGVAILLPCGDIGPMLKYVKKHFGPKPSHEPAMRAWQLLEKGEYVWCPVPSLVEHMAPRDSTVGNESDHVIRVAAKFDASLTASEVDYTKTNNVPTVYRGGHVDGRLEEWKREYGTPPEYYD